MLHPIYQFEYMKWIYEWIYECHFENMKYINILILNISIRIYEYNECIYIHIYGYIYMNIWSIDSNIWYLGLFGYPQEGSVTMTLY